MLTPPEQDCQSSIFIPQSNRLVPQKLARPHYSCNHSFNDITQITRRTVIPLHTFSGVFYRAVRPERLNDVLQPPDQTSAGRYHRHGQTTLYMSPSLEWSRIAVSGYMREDGLSRLIVPLQVDDAQVFDQRDGHACAQLGIDRNLSNASSRQAMQDGKTPPSWSMADMTRNIPADEIIDISRHIPQGWHLNLFRWNGQDGPQVKIIGEPTEVHPKTHGAKWS